jgi:hypothetical protein
MPAWGTHRDTRANARPCGFLDRRCRSRVRTDRLAAHRGPHSLRNAGSWLSNAAGGCCLLLRRLDRVGTRYRPNRSGVSRHVAADRVPRHGRDVTAAPGAGDESRFLHTAAAGGYPCSSCEPPIVMRAAVRAVLHQSAIHRRCEMSRLIRILFVVLPLVSVPAMAAAFDRACCCCAQACCDDGCVDCCCHG